MCAFLVSVQTLRRAGGSSPASCSCMGDLVWVSGSQASLVTMGICEVNQQMAAVPKSLSENRISMNSSLDHLLDFKS